MKAILEYVTSRRLPTLAESSQSARSVGSLRSRFPSSWRSSTTHVPVYRSRADPCACERIVPRFFSRPKPLLRRPFRTGESPRPPHYGAAVARCIGPSADCGRSTLPPTAASAFPCSPTAQRRRRPNPTNYSSCTANQGRNSATLMTQYTCTASCTD